MLDGASENSRQPICYVRKFLKDLISLGMQAGSRTTDR